jgi:hypothetical protein
MGGRGGGSEGGREGGWRGMTGELEELAPLLLAEILKSQCLVYLPCVSWYVYNTLKFNNQSTVKTHVFACCGAVTPSYS